MTTTSNVELSPNLKRILVEQFSPSDLHHIAASVEAERPRMIARRNLSPEAVEELASMLVASKWPTIGWWRRNRTEAAP